MQENALNPDPRRALFQNFHKDTKWDLRGSSCCGLCEKKVLVELLMRNYAETQGILIQPNEREEQ